jgi:uncharacterized protein
MKNSRGLSRRVFLSGMLAAGASACRNGMAEVLLTESGSGEVAARGDSADAYAWDTQGILELRKSPFAKLHCVPVHAVAIQEGFWSERRHTNRTSSIPSLRVSLEEHGRMDNFRRLSGRSQAPRLGRIASDADVYKWLEGASFVLQSQDDPELRGQVQDIVSMIKAAQEPGGYLNTYYVGEHVPERMTPLVQETGSELYCFGHMLQAAIAYYRATGDPVLIETGQRFLDQFLIPSYGPAEEKKPIVSGHPEVEMALIELYRTTGDRRYLDLAGYILQGDERIPLSPEKVDNLYCGIPFTSRTKLQGGHAVRALYACCGATDYYLETGDRAYLRTLSLLWEDLHDRQMYITGGLGALSQGESFGDDYEMPNARAYCESCAAIASMMWNWRMLAATGDAQYADMIEQALYNGINSGMSLDGRTYCYRNPLAFDPAWSTGDRHTPNGQLRNSWYDTTCCPPNLERTFASLPGYFYSMSEQGVYVNLYDNSELNWMLASGNKFRLRQTTRYPWDGDIAIDVTCSSPETYTVFVRIPRWSQRCDVRVNGKPAEGARPGTYLPIRRHWTGGEVIRIKLDMTPRLIRANEAVLADTGRVAFQRGPVVFCMEGQDQSSQPQSSLSAYSVYDSGDTSFSYDPAVLRGVGVLNHPGWQRSAPSSQPLYQVSSENRSEAKPVDIKMVPYYAWGNRGMDAMQVWISLAYPGKGS